MDTRRKYGTAHLDLIKPCIFNQLPSDLGYNDPMLSPAVTPSRTLLKLSLPERSSVPILPMTQHELQALLHAEQAQLVEQATVQMNEHVGMSTLRLRLLLKLPRRLSQKWRPKSHSKCKRIWESCGWDGARCSTPAVNPMGSRPVI